jgi:CheY-like chemotaxis protein
MSMRDRDFSLRVLVVAGDRRFRAVTSALLEQRGCSVSVEDDCEDAPRSAARAQADVVLLDASRSLSAAARTAARLGSLQPPIGMVAVSADGPGQVAALPVLPKWGPFDALFGAIQGARGAGAGG